MARSNFIGNLSVTRGACAISVVRVLAAEKSLGLALFSGVPGVGDDSEPKKPPKRNQYSKGDVFLYFYSFETFAHTAVLCVRTQHQSRFCVILA